MPRQPMPAPDPADVWGAANTGYLNYLSDNVDTHTAQITLLQAGGAAAPAQRTVTTDTTLALIDTGGTVFVNSASPRNITVPANSAVAFLIGSWVQITNIGAGVVTIVDGTAGGSTTFTTLAQNETCRLVKQATNTWYQL